MTKTMATMEYDRKLVDWNDAWETLLWKFVEGRIRGCVGRWVDDPMTAPRRPAYSLGQELIT